MRGIDYSMNIDGPSDFFRRPLLLSAAAWLRGLRARGQGMEGQSCIQKRDGAVKSIRSCWFQVWRLKQPEETRRIPLSTASTAELTWLEFPWTLRLSSGYM